MSPLEAAGLIAAGVAVGAYAAAIGTGGGFLLTPLLLIRHPGAGPAVVTAASLSVVVLSSWTSSLIAVRHRRLDMPLVGLLAAAAVPAALVGASLTALIPRDAFALGIGGLLAVLAVYLGWRPQAPATSAAVAGWHRVVTDGRGVRFEYRVPVVRGVITTAGAAFVSAVAGAGGGIFYVPLETRVMRVPHALAVPAAHMVIATLSVVVVTYHLLAGHMGEPMADVPWLGLGVIAANPLGQWLNRRLGEGPLTRLLAAGLLLIAVRTASGVS